MKYAGIVLLAAGTSMLFAQSPPQGDKPKDQQIEKSEIVPSLFVIGARGCEYADGKLTLKGTSATTVIFADRPKRMGGHIPTREIVDGWAEGPDSFEKTPPNADLSIFTSSEPKNSVVELRHPRLEGDTLTFDVRVISGDVPARGDECSLFIDIIGRPWTPMSYAGVARRSYARACYYPAPHVVIIH